MKRLWPGAQPWRGWVPAVYLILSIAFFLPAFMTGRVPLPLENVYAPADPFGTPDPYWRSYRPPEGSNPPNYTGIDITNYWYPYMRDVVSRLQQGEVPLWNPKIYSGLPLLGVQQAAVLYPLNLLFIPLGPVWIWPATAIARLFLMGWGLHLLMRRYGVSHAAAFWSGITYQFSGSGVTYLHWSNHNVLAFLPLALWSTERLLSQPRGRWFLLLTGCLAFQFLGGHPETSVLFALVWGSFTLVCINWREHFVRSWLLAGGAALAAAGLTLMQLLPAVELIPESVTYVRRQMPAFLASLQQGVGDWAQLRHWFLIVNPYIYGTPVGNRAIPPHLNYHILVTYMGVLTIPWLIAGMVGAQPPRWRWYWTAVALGSLSLTYVLPGFDRLLTLPVLSLSQGSRFNQSWNLAGAVLAGFGVDWTLRGGRHTRRFVALMATICVLILGWSTYDLATAADGSWILKGIPAPVILQRIADFFNRTSLPLVGFLGCAVLGWLFYLALAIQKNVRMHAWILLLLAVGELFFHGLPFNGYARPSVVYPRTRVTDALHQTPGKFRIWAMDGIMEPNRPMTQDLEDAYGNDDLVSWRYYLFTGRSSKIGLEEDTYIILPVAQRFFDLANIRYLLTTKPVRAQSPAPNWREVMRDGPVYVHENPTVLPRAFVVGSVQPTSADEALGAVFEPDFDPMREAVVEEEIAGLPHEPPEGMQATATIVQYEPERVVVSTEQSRQGLLVLSDSHAPGWHATVDGKPARIYRANAVYRGVLLPAGKHEVVFTYRPASWILGLWAAGVTLVVCLAGCWWSRSRRGMHAWPAVGGPDTQA